MPRLNPTRSQEPFPFRSCDPPRRPCLLVAEQGNGLNERRTCYREQVPRAPPPSPTEITPLTYAEPNETRPSVSCAMLLVDRKLEEHHAKLSPMQHRKQADSDSPALMSESVSGMKLEIFEEPMHKSTPLGQFSSTFDVEERTVTNSSCSSSRSSAVGSLADDIASDREVGFLPTAIGVHCQRQRATSPQYATHPSAPNSPTFGLSSIRSFRSAVADAPSRFRYPSQNDEASDTRPTVTGSEVSSPTPTGSSPVPDIAALHTSKTKSWPGPCSQLSEPDIIGMPNANMRSNSPKCGFACAPCREREARYDGRMPSCGYCLSRNKTCSFNRFTINLQSLKEHAEGEEATDEQHAATMEEEYSHFSDYSTDEDDDGEKALSNVRLVNSLGRLNHRSKTRLSWGKLFSKP